MQQNILVCDDDKEIVEAIEIYLEQEGFKVFKAYDGVEALEVLKKNELKYVVAVVTRYFGGTKLGAGGLIRAYSKSVSSTLKEIGIVERAMQIPVKCTVSYSASGKL